MRGHLLGDLQAAAVLEVTPSMTYYFDACRLKRNVIDYNNSSVATETEAEELLGKAVEFHELVEGWVATNYPAFAP